MRQLPIVLTLGTGLALAAATGAASAADPVVIDLTQVGCQFLESENGQNHDFKPKSAEDCNDINGRTGAQRLAAAKVLELAPGSYVFRVTNLDVPYDLGFWLREHDYNRFNPLHKLSKTSVSGGGLSIGTTKDYEVELKPGEYVYSCPLNPTPNYRLIVKG
jgi:hypothetical protein